MAKSRGLAIYLAGGVVRDLLLGQPIRDVDLVVAGEAVPFSRALAARLGARLKVHGRFGTATLELASGQVLDVAGARREWYAHPGALPSIAAAGSIEEDLARRDFTINAMAMEIFPGRRRFLDLRSGVDDLGRRAIRALHPSSFHDDPTRAFRAVRYAIRLGFRIPAETRRQISMALAAGAFGRISGDRMRRELRRIFEEPRRPAAVRLLRELGLDAAIDGSLAGDSGADAVIQAAQRIASRHPGRTTWVCYLLAWMWLSDPDAARRTATRLALSGAESRRVGAWPQVRERLLAGKLARLSPSAIGRLALGLSGDEIVAAAAGLGPGPDRRALLRHGGLRTGVELRIRGADLRSAGIPAGPAIGRALAETLAARRDGRIPPEQELDYALRRAMQARP